MTEKSRASYLRQHRLGSLEGDLKSTQAFIPSRYYKRASELSEEQKERLPRVLGRLIVYAIDHLYGKNPAPAYPGAPVQPAPLETDMTRLTQAILSSRYPADTGPARFRQLGFLNIVAAMTKQGRFPSASSIARETGVHRTQIERLSKTLAARGVITIERMLSAESSPTTVKVFAIRPVAVDALSAHHLAETGMAINLAAPSPANGGDDLAG